MALRTHALFAAMAGLALAGAAAAQDSPTVGAQATFRGEVPAGCQLSAASASMSANIQVSALSAGSADIAINQLVGEDGAPIGATVVLVVPAVCNQAHTLKLSSLNGALLGDGPETAGGPFRSSLPYQVTVAWAEGQQSFGSGDEALSVPVVDAAMGPVTVTIQIPAGGAPLAAGAYSDELVLELGAAG